MNAKIFTIYYIQSLAGSVSISNIFTYSSKCNCFICLIEGNFQYFDYGPKTNMEKYGQDTPPQYDMEKITAPFALFYAQNDWLAGPEVRLVFCSLFKKNQ